MSDLHGQYAAYERMLTSIHFGDTDRLYILGDVIDRGPDGIRLLQAVLADQRVTLLLGNHELMMLEALRHPKDDVMGFRWLRNGCLPTREAYDRLDAAEQQRLLEAIEALPTELEATAGGRTYRLVHAAPEYLYDPKNERGWDVRKWCVWHRLSADAALRDTETLIFGHTTVKHYTMKAPQEVWFGPHMIDVDCGCADADEGRLGCLRLDDLAVFYEEL